MPIPNKFQEPSQPLIGSYDWYDAFVEVGYKTFYGAHTSGAYFLTTNAIIGRVEASATETSEEWTLIPGGSTNDLDFDIEVKKQFIMKGDAYVTVPLLRWNGSGSPSSYGGWATANLYHVDGTTSAETLLGSGKDGAKQTLGASVKQEVQIVFRFTGINQVFKVGDKIRLNIIGEAEGGASLYSYIAHSPTNSSITGLSQTQIRLEVPIKLDN